MAFRFPLVSATNWVDRPGVVLSAEDQAGDLSPAEVATRSPQDFWRSSREDSPGVERWFALDLGQDRRFNAVVGRWDRDSVVPAPSDTIRLRIDAAGGTPGTGAVYDNGDPGPVPACAVDPRKGYWVQLFETPVVGRYLRLDLSFAAALEAELGQLLVLDAVEMSRSRAYGPEMAPASNGEARFGPSGRTDARRGKRFWIADLVLPWLSEADRAAWEAIDYDAAETGQIFLCTDPQAPNTSTIVGLRPEGVPATTRRNLRLGEKAVRIREDV